VLTIIDPDPNGDGNATDAAAVGTILLANGSTGAGATDGRGGQGVKPLPMTHDGWIQPTVALLGTGTLSPEVEGWDTPAHGSAEGPFQSSSLRWENRRQAIKKECFSFLFSVDTYHPTRTR